MREVLEMRLTEWGFHVVVAGDGAEARLLAERERPDVVISDVQLPELSGLALLQLLKTGDRDRPVILITAYGSIDEAVEAMKLGAHDFLTKPLDYAKLRATLAGARSGTWSPRLTRGRGSPASWAAARECASCSRCSKRWRRATRR
jgi:DNA-binding NtrC family response regulator